MEDLLLIFVPAVLISLAMKYKFAKEITTKESLITLGANLMISFIFLGILAAGQALKMHDTELWSGYVTGKERNKVSCSHSYSCNCRQSCSGSGKSRSCSTTCDTCYDHSYDVDWDVKTTRGSYTIDRVDRRGLDEPRRWSVVKEGEYVVESNSYQNPLLADESTLFVELPGMKNQEYFYPDYPTVHDYWKIKRVMGIKGDIANEVNDYLNDVLKTVGAKKQLNVIVVGSYVTSPDYFNGLMAHWRGGKKNDVILVYGLDKDNNIIWFKSNSYAMGMGNKELHYRLAANATSQPFTLDHIKSQMQLTEKHFVRLSTEELKFKAMAIDTPLWAIVLLAFINLLTSIAISVYMKNNDLGSGRTIYKTRR